MTDVQRFLAELADIGEGAPVVTLYLDTRWRDEQQRDRVRIFFRERAKEAEKVFVEGAHLASLKRTLARLETYVDELINQDRSPEANGVVLVASEERGIFRELIVTETLPMAMFVDLRPRLYPLMEAIAPIQHALLVVVDQHGAQIIEQIAGEVVEERQIDRDVGRLHKAGGWEQHKLQHNVKEHIQSVWKECALLLTQLAGAPSHPSIILFGQEQNIRGFEKLLPRDVMAHVIDVLPASGNRTALLEAARKSLLEDRLTRDLDEVHKIVSEANAGRMAVVGLAGVLAASNERRIRELAMTRSFDVSGFLCGNCGALWHAGGTGCVFCEGQTRVVSLREELVRRCLAESARVFVVGDGTSLDTARGIGALLRHLSGDVRQSLGNFTRQGDGAHV